MRKGNDIDPTLIHRMCLWMCWDYPDGPMHWEAYPEGYRSTPVTVLAPAGTRRQFARGRYIIDVRQPGCGAKHLYEVMTVGGEPWLDPIRTNEKRIRLEIAKGPAG